MVIQAAPYTLQELYCMNYGKYGVYWAWIYDPQTWSSKVSIVFGLDNILENFLWPR